MFLKMSPKEKLHPNWTKQKIPFDSCTDRKNSKQATDDTDDKADETKATDSSAAKNRQEVESAYR